MGKKSKRSKPKKGQKGGSALPAPAVASGSPLEDTVTAAPPERAEEKPPAGASCWICLDGDPDDGGKPIVRDCSCRGNDAGFAHLSCLIKYAEGKTRELMSAPRFDNVLPDEPWTTCPNCCRDYQRRVAIDMATAWLSYLDENHRPSLRIDMTKLDALTMILRTITLQMPFEEIPDLRDEGRLAANSFISIVQESGAHDTDLMFAYCCLARFADAEKTDDGYETALDCYAKVRDYYESQEMEENVSTYVDAVMQQVKSRRGGGRGEITETEENMLQRMRISYEKSIVEHGVDSFVTLEHGISLLGGLNYYGRRGLEYETVASKLYAISRRANGPDHIVTQRAETEMKRIRVRIIGNCFVVYEVLRISDDGRKYVVKKEAPDGKAWVNGEGRLVGEDIAEVAFDDEDYVMVKDTPVVCHGLKSAAHLNGKLGEAQSFNKDIGRYVVRFEDRSLGTVSVRPINLRIVFELPEEP